ncbi:SWIM zinc finger family protein, partial [Stutzerimonas nitrititolerans]
KGCAGNGASCRCRTWQGNAITCVHA